MRRIVAGGMIMAVCATFSAGCAQVEKLVGGEAPKSVPSSTPPKPAPALGTAEAKRVVLDWARAYNKAAKKYDIKAAEKIETGALLEGHRAEFKVIKFNDLTIPPMRATSALTIPKFTGWPKWFTVTMTTRSEKPVIDEVVFVQETQGAPWKAGSDVVHDRRVAKALGAAIDTPAVAEVVPANDATLAIAPGRLAAAHAHAVRYGTKSPHARLFGTSGEITEDFKLLMDAHKLFRKNGWAGRSTVTGSTHPTYALRTASGGAIAFYSVDIKATYKRVKGDMTFSWTGGIGKLYPALLGAEYAEDEVTRVERTEYAAYVPPKGKGKIHIVGSRWTPVSAEGS